MHACIVGWSPGTLMTTAFASDGGNRIRTGRIKFLNPMSFPFKRRYKLPRRSTERRDEDLKCCRTPQPADLNTWGRTYPVGLAISKVPCQLGPTESPRSLTD